MPDAAPVITAVFPFSFMWRLLRCRFQFLDSVMVYFTPASFLRLFRLMRIADMVLDVEPSALMVYREIRPRVYTKSSEIQKLIIAGQVRGK